MKVDLYMKARSSCATQNLFQYSVKSSAEEEAELFDT